MADLTVSATSLNYVSVPPGSGDAVSTSFGYGYGGDKGQIGIFFNLLASNVPLDLPGNTSKTVDLISVKQDEGLPAGNPPYPDTPGDGKDHYYPAEGHGFAKRENRIDSITRMVAWFDKYLKGN